MVEQSRDDTHTKRIDPPAAIGRWEWGDPKPSAHKGASGPLAKLRKWLTSEGVPETNADEVSRRIASFAEQNAISLLGPPVTLVLSVEPPTPKTKHIWVSLAWRQPLDERVRAEARSVNRLFTEFDRLMRISCRPKVLANLEILSPPDEFRPKWLDEAIQDLTASTGRRLFGVLHQKGSKPPHLPLSHQG